MFEIPIEHKNAVKQWIKKQDTIIMNKQNSKYPKYGKIY